MSLFRLDASIRTAGSHSRALADVVEGEWRATRSGEDIVRREIGIDPLPADAWATAVSAAGVLPRDRSNSQRSAVALAATLAGELASATALLFAVPLYNFGVSQHFKTFADLVITDPRMAGGLAPPTKGTPALLITVRGGSYLAGVQRSAWDHSTSWIRHVLEDVWRLDLLVLEADIALVGADAATDRCRQLAAKLHAWADGGVRVRGAALAAPLGANGARVRRGRGGHSR